MYLKGEEMRQEPDGANSELLTGTGPSPARSSATPPAATGATTLSSAFFLEAAGKCLKDWHGSVSV